MPETFSDSIVEIDLGAETERAPVALEPDAPFRMLIAGDFSGGRSTRRVFEVDRDNLDLVLAELRPELHLPLALSFSSLEDFEPDRIFDRVPLFQALEQAPAPEAEGKPPKADPGRLLAQALEETEARRAAEADRALDDFSALVRDIVAPHLEPRPEARHAELKARLDAASGALMREFLHHPDFQALEAAWRSLDFLVRRLETGTSLKLYILDVTKEGLASEMKGGDLRASGIACVLVRQTEPWAVWAGNFIFEETTEDLLLLAYLGGIARAAGAPFLAAAKPLAADAPPCSTWQELRSLPEAAWLGLALPGFLLRLPYGKDTCPIERFPFEEMPEGSEHEAYLWGNPAFACLYLIGEAFTRFGWSLRPGAVSQIGDLPLHTYRAGGEACLKPCAETPLTEDAAVRLLERGLMPLVWLKGSDAVRLLRFQSLADPLAPLAGRWR